MIDGLPANGPNPARAAFFREMAMAMQFLSLYHSLSKDSQEELMAGVKSFAAELYNKDQEKKK